MIYKDSQSTNTYIKRFAVKSIARNKEYNICKNCSDDKILYLTVNPNGEAEKVNIHFRALKKIKNLKLEIDFSKILIKGRSSIGNIVTKKPVKRVELKETGISTLEARKIWFDNSINRLNVDGRGEFLGDFSTDDKIITINQKGEIEFKSFDLINHFDDDLILIEKYSVDTVISLIYFNGNKNLFYVKRFIPEIVSKPTMLFNFSKGSYLENVTTDINPVLELLFKKENGRERETKSIDLSNFISVKGQSAKGKILSKKKIFEIEIKKSKFFRDEKNKFSFKNEIKNDSQISLKL